MFWEILDDNWLFSNRLVSTIFTLFFFASFPFLFVTLLLLICCPKKIDSLWSFPFFMASLVLFIVSTKERKNLFVQSFIHRSRWYSGHKNCIVSLFIGDVGLVNLFDAIVMHTPEGFIHLFFYSLQSSLSGLISPLNLYYSINIWAKSLFLYITRLVHQDKASQ